MCLLSETESSFRQICEKISILHKADSINALAAKTALRVQYLRTSLCESLFAIKSQTQREEYPEENLRRDISLIVDDCAYNLWTLNNVDKTGAQLWIGLLAQSMSKQPSVVELIKLVKSLKKNKYGGHSSLDLTSILSLFGNFVDLEKMESTLGQVEEMWLAEFPDLDLIKKQFITKVIRSAVALSAISPLSFQLECIPAILSHFWHHQILDEIINDYVKAQIMETVSAIASNNATIQLLLAAFM